MTDRRNEYTVAFGSLNGIKEHFRRTGLDPRVLLTF
jgi:hypothetical protein